MLALLLGALAPASADARDYGQQGTVYPVIETDLLSAIQAKLAAAQSIGRIAGMQKELTRKTIAKVKRPTPVAGVSDAKQSRQWVYDPSITLSQDVRDAHGVLIAAAGTHIDPLDHAPLRQALVFIDGDNPAQVRWAMAHTTALNAKIILTSGSVFDLMKAEQRRIYFDQQGLITTRLGITHVPAIVVQQGRVLRITELALPGDRK